MHGLAFLRRGELWALVILTIQMRGSRSSVKAIIDMFLILLRITYKEDLFPKECQLIESK